MFSFFLDYVKFCWYNIVKISCFNSFFFLEIVFSGDEMVSILSKLFVS